MRCSFPKLRVARGQVQTHLKKVSTRTGSRSTLEFSATTTRDPQEVPLAAKTQIWRGQGIWPFSTIATMTWCGHRTAVCPMWTQFERWLVVQWWAVLIEEKLLFSRVHEIRTCLPKAVSGQVVDLHGFQQRNRQARWTQLIAANKTFWNWLARRVRRSQTSMCNGKPKIWKFLPILINLKMPSLWLSIGKPWSKWLQKWELLWIRCKPLKFSCV